MDKQHQGKDDHWATRHICREGAYIKMELWKQKQMCKCLVIDILDTFWQGRQSWPFLQNDCIPYNFLPILSSSSFYMISGGESRNKYRKRIFQSLTSPEPTHENCTYNVISYLNHTEQCKLQIYTAWLYYCKMCCHHHHHGVSLHGQLWVQ